jgi:DNA-directed RNA polymerase specialized sigma24 family protein
MEQRLLDEQPSPRLVARVRTFNRQALAEVFDGSFDDLYLYVHALVADHDTAERVAEDTFGRVLDRLPDYSGDPGDLKGWVLHHAADAVRRVPRTALAGKGVREAVARLGRFDHEAVTLRLLAGLDAPTVATATGRRTSSVLGSLVTGLRALRTGTGTLNPLSLPTQQRQLDAALDRLLAGDTPVAAAEWAPLVTDAAGLLAAASGVVGLPREPAPPAVRAHVRGRFLAGAEERRAGWFHRTYTPAEVPGRKPRKEPSRVSSATAMGLAMLLALVAGVVLAIAAAFASPDSAAYGLKRAGESALLALSTDRVSKADLEVKLAGERTKEAESMSAARHADLTVQAVNARFDDLRAAADDLAGIPVSHRDKRWKSVRDRLEADASKPVTDIERTLTASGHKVQAAEVKQSYERFQIDRKEFDKKLGVGGPAPLPSAPPGQPQPGASPPK